MADLSFDLIAIADVGSQPRKIASAILDQIRRQLGSLPLPLPLLEIAAGLGVNEVVTHQSSAFEGMLVTLPDRSKGIISLREGMPSGRRNFTLGHEIGHFVSIHHRPPPTGFKCGSAGLRMERRQHVWDVLDIFARMEIEANEFSQALLVPIPEYRAETKAMRQSDLEHIDKLRRRFGVSKAMMAQIYVDTAPEETAIVVSRHGCFNRLIAKKSFPFLGLKSGVPLPSASKTTQILKTQSIGHLSSPVDVSPETWVENTRGCHALSEQVLVQRDGWAMTMLVVERAEYEDFEHDNRVERAWVEPKFAYDR